MEELMNVPADQSVSFFEYPTSTKKALRPRNTTIAR